MRLAEQRLNFDSYIVWRFRKIWKFCEIFGVGIFGFLFCPFFTIFRWGNCFVTVFIWMVLWCCPRLLFSPSLHGCQWLLPGLLPKFGFPPFYLPFKSYTNSNQNCSLSAREMTTSPRTWLFPGVGLAFKNQKYPALFRVY